MKDCGQEDCYSCRKTYCVNGCYNESCSKREDISAVSGNGCVHAHNCIGFVSRQTHIKRNKIK